MKERTSSGHKSRAAAEGACWSGLCLYELPFDESERLLHGPDQETDQYRCENGSFPDAADVPETAEGEKDCKKNDGGVKTDFCSAERDAVFI